MDAFSLVFGAGDRIRGDGRLIRDSSGDWFEPWLMVRSSGWVAAGRPAPKHTRFAVPIDGVDFEDLNNRYERDGAIAGGAAITGVWRDGRIELQHQVVGAKFTEGAQRPEWKTPPCPAPPGGWPRGFPGPIDDNLDFNLGDLKKTGAAVSVVTFRPSKDQAVLVVAATDIAVVHAQLGPQLLDRLCVVPSRYTAKQVGDVRAHLKTVPDTWKAYGSGESCGEDAQTVVTVKLLRVTDDVAGWHSTQPAGLVTLLPNLWPAKQRSTFPTTSISSTSP